MTDATATPAANESVEVPEASAPRPASIRPSEAETLHLEKAQVLLTLRQVQHQNVREELQRAQGELDALLVQTREKEEALRLKVEALSGRAERATLAGQQAQLAFDRTFGRILSASGVEPEYHSAYKPEFDRAGTLKTIADPSLGT